jgi:hypothetical protein
MASLAFLVKLTVTLVSSPDLDVCAGEEPVRTASRR